MMIYVLHATKVMLIVQNEELLLPNLHAIFVSKKQNLSTPILVRVFLGKNQRVLHQEIQHTEKLLHQEVVTLLSQLLAIFVLMDVSHAPMTKPNVFIHVIKPYQ